jgi:hypothetical protein
VKHETRITSAAATLRLNTERVELLEQLASEAGSREGIAGHYHNGDVSPRSSAPRRTAEGKGDALKAYLGMFTDLRVDGPTLTADGRVGALLLFQGAVRLRPPVPLWLRQRHRSCV